MEIRGAGPLDAEGIARVHTQSWQHAYRGVVSDEYLDALRWEQRYEMWNAALVEPTMPGTSIFVAIDADEVVTGFASIGLVRDDDLREREFFELYAIYLAPEMWRRGIGTQIMNAALGAVPTSAPGVTLWVLAENERGRRFYERHNFAFDGTSRVQEIGDRRLEELRYLLPGEKLARQR